MPLARALADFRSAVAQCDSLIANAHRLDAAGVALFPPVDQEQITVAAFLNMFKAWEAFLEESLACLMTGATTVGGGSPVKYVAPRDEQAARQMVIGAQKYFDYANHDNVRKIVRMYFDQGYPFEPHISAIFSDLADLKTMRNASAHISSSTQTPLESLANRIFAGPRPGITLYQLLMAVDPRSPAGDTVFLTYKNKLIVAAELISNG